MNNYITKKTSFILSISILCAVVTILSCNKKFDEPPAYVPPDLKPTLTIAQLKQKHVAGSTETITNDDIIAGTVIANDSSGNFYKQIIIQDSTGGIAIGIDDYNLYTSYPIGRTVFVKLNTLIMYDYHNLIQIGGSKDVTNAVSPIAASVKDQFVVRGALGAPIVPKEVALADVYKYNSSLQNTLIKITDAEFKDTTVIYADTSSAKNTVNLTLENCSKNTIALRTSGYASFAGIKVPSGKGSIVAVYSVYNTGPQLFIRDTSDVQFLGARCDGSGGGGTDTSTAVQTTIASIRSMYSGNGIKLGAYKIGGTVISDASTKNISTGSVVIQDGSNAGISLYLGGTISFIPGDSITLTVKGDSLTKYKGAMEIDAYGATPTKVATGKTVTPKTVTVATINSTLSTLEYTLVKVLNAKASGGSTYSGSNTLKDASGSMTLYTSSTATFATTALPTAASDWVGYAKYFGTTGEFQLRSPADVTATSGGGGTDTTTNPGGGDTTTNPGGGTGSGISLTTSPFTLNFDNIASGLPTGVSVKVSAKSSALGTDGTYTSTAASWNGVTAGFKNFASATGLTATSTTADQSAATNRALGVRQTSATGDPGAAFVFLLNNTTGKSNLALSFLLQSLDNTVGRTTIWKVDYATGDNPTTFTTIATSPTPLTTGTTFTSTPVSVNFGSALNNQTGKVWIRIVTLDATTGGGNRPSTGIDDFKLTWQ